MARVHLATHGAGGLSLRAIARDLGMAASAVYRYYASRDDLLTALIVDGYNAIGETVERADAAVGREDYMARWVATCQAVRRWALEHPHEYALVYGSPVPGYHAPPGTVDPAVRDKAVFGRIVADAYRSDALSPADPAPVEAPALTSDLVLVRDAIMPGVPDDVIISAVTAWAGLFGMVSLELFGHFNNIISEREAFFDRSVISLARMIGFRP